MTPLSLPEAERAQAEFDRQRELLCIRVRDFLARTDLGYTYREIEEGVGWNDATDGSIGYVIGTLMSRHEVFQRKLPHEGPIFFATRRPKPRPALWRRLLHRRKKERT